MLAFIMRYLNSGFTSTYQTVWNFLCRYHQHTLNGTKEKKMRDITTDCK